MCGFSLNRRKWKRQQREKRSRNNWRIFFLLTWVRSRRRSPRNRGGGEGPSRFQGQSLKEPRPEFHRDLNPRGRIWSASFSSEEGGSQGAPSAQEGGQHPRKDEEAACSEHATSLGRASGSELSPGHQAGPTCLCLSPELPMKECPKRFSDTDFWLFPYRHWRNHFLGGVMLQFPCM